MLPSTSKSKAKMVLKQLKLHELRVNLLTWDGGSKRTVPLPLLPLVTVVLNLATKK